MNARALNALAGGVICRAQENGKRTPMGIAIAVDSAGLLMSPETAAESARLAAENRELRARVAELEAAQAPAEVTIYRASHESIVMGLYTTREAAREHCETLMHREQPDADLNWYPDTTEGDDEEAPEGLFMVVAGEESDTGYVVTPLTVASEYDAEADE